MSCGKFCSKVENDKNEKIVELLKVLKIIGENKMEENEEVKKCKFCGAELKGDVLFCTNCGKKIEEEKKVCAKCGAELAEDAKFCPKCGEKVITSITCPKCGKELQPDSKFCQFCGANLNETLECPKCHVELPLGTKFCPKCGCNIQNPDLDDDSDDEDEYDNYDSDDDDNNDYEEDDYDESDYSDDDDSDNYFYYEEEKSTKEKITEIVDKYIETINKDSSSYNSREISGGSYEQVFQNVRLKITPEVARDDILGFIDTTVLGKGKSGLVFTSDSIYEKEPGGSIRLPYNIITGMYIKSSKLYFMDTKGCGKGLNNFDEVYIDSTWYNIVALKDCLEEIKSVL